MSDSDSGDDGRSGSGGSHSSSGRTVPSWSTVRRAMRRETLAVVGVLLLLVLIVS